MLSLNVLIAGEGKSLQMVKNSRLLNKLYITSDDDVEGAVSIKFNTFKELAKKCKALQVDLVIVENEKWILQGIADVLRKNFINCIAPDSKWAGIIKANKTVKTLLNKYDILTPQVLAFPKKFPLTFKADGFSKIAYSMEELFDIRNEINNYSDELVKTVFLEEYIQGEEITVSSLFDGKSVVSFYQDNLNKNQILCLKKYDKQLELMLRSEKADFIGFIASNLIWDGESFYNKSFGLDFPKLKCDILYILISAIYQKLDEINLFLNQDP